MAFFNNISKKVEKTAKAAARKSGDLVEVAKLNMSINSDESKIQEIASAIGKGIYKMYREGKEVPETLIESCREIKGIEDHITAVKAKIMEIKNMKICPNCKAEVQNNVEYCPKCGTKFQ